MPPPVGLVDNGDGKPSVHDTRTGGPREVVPSLATGWSHHWRQGGPITGDEMVPSLWRNSRQVVPSHWRATREHPKSDSRPPTSGWPVVCTAGNGCPWPLMTVDTVLGRVEAAPKGCESTFRPNGYRV